jgi:hypothetical protein
VIRFVQDLVSADGPLGYRGFGDIFQEFGIHEQFHYDSSAFGSAPAASGRPLLKK